jgi:hypothetical protein
VPNLALTSHERVKSEGEGALGGEKEQWFPQLGQGTLITLAGGRALLSLQEEEALVEYWPFSPGKGALIYFLIPREDHCFSLLK